MPRSGRIKISIIRDKMRWFRVSKQVLNQLLRAWVSCLTPAPWGQQTNRVCLPVSSDTQSLDRDPPFISNGISSSEITSVTSEWPWWTSRGWWMMFLLASRHYWLPEWNGMETRVTRTQDTFTLLSRMSGLNTPLSVYRVNTELGRETYL